MKPIKVSQLIQAIQAVTRQYRLIVLPETSFFEQYGKKSTITVTSFNGAIEAMIAFFAPGEPDTVIVEQLRHKDNLIMDNLFLAVHNLHVNLLTKAKTPCAQVKEAVVKYNICQGCSDRMRAILTSLVITATFPSHTQGHVFAYYYDIFTSTQSIQQP